MSNPVIRWWVVGVLFLLVGMGILYVFEEFLRLPLVLATLLGAEIGTLLRFLANDRWVFGYDRPTWLRLWKYHVANAGGFCIWWSVSNILPRYGVHYLVAAVVATACSVSISMLTNFLWVWRARARARPL